MSDADPRAADCGAALDTCGCCGTGAPGTAAEAASEIANPPGLPALAYRIGTQPQFLERMLKRLVSQTVVTDDGTRELRPLASLTTRAPDDPAVALLDAWATTADVLTFYQERIANEGFLRTAIERRSVLELARTIGYELNPGVAASTELAFTLESATVAPLTAASVVPAVVTLGEGLRVQSVPGPGQTAQTFETVEEVEARPEWNLLYPRKTKTQGLELGETVLWLDGIATGLQVGDALLLVGKERVAYGGSENWDFRFVAAVELDAPNGRTKVTWTEGLGYKSSTRRVEPADDPTCYVFRARGSLFGYNAPDWRAMPGTIKAAFDPANNDLSTSTGAYTGLLTEWPGFTTAEGADEKLDLDAPYPKVVPGSWIVLSKADYTELYRVQTALPAARTDWTLASKVTRLTLDAREHLSWFPRRETVVFLQSEELALTEAPDSSLVGGLSVQLDRTADGLAGGRTLIVSGRRRRVRAIDLAKNLFLVSTDGRTSKVNPGEVLWMTAPSTTAGTTVTWHLRNRLGVEGTVADSSRQIEERDADEADELLSEVVVLDEATDDGVRTTLRLQNPGMQRWYDRGSARIWANVAAATHGETVSEVLGSGDGSRANQSFTLKRPPLTYVSAATETGTETTLEVRVNDLLWSEVAALNDAGPESQVYTVRHADDGTATVQFGDGIRGARLPTGSANVTATYRTGIGPAGEVGTGTLSLLQSRPLGLKEVTNPVAATGAAAPEVLEDARGNAPRTVLTLGRIVSLKDFEDFARAFGGIGKARAVALWSGERQVIHITIAAATGGSVSTDSDVYGNLVSAIDRYREGSERVKVESYAPRTFRLDAAVIIDPVYVAATVLAEADAALRAAFAFEARDFAQPVTGAEVISVIQAVPGIVAVDLDRLELVGQSTGSGLPAAKVLPSQTTRFSGTTTLPSELLLLDDHGVTLREVPA